VNEFNDKKFKFSQKGKYQRDRVPRPTRAEAKEPSKPNKTKRKTSARQEQKFQMIKLIKSGRSLREVNALTKSTAVAFFPEYSKQGDRKDLLAIEGTLERLTRTRGQAIDLAKLKFGPRKSLPVNRNEFIAKWLTEGRISWKRDGNLVAKGPPTPSRPGSSEGKIGLTKVIGAKRLARDLKGLIRAFKKLNVAPNKLKGIGKSIGKAVRIEGAK